VAPVFSETGEVEYYLPAGEWTNFLTGETVSGGRWLRERHGYLSLPLLARECSLVATGACEDRPDYEWAERARLRLHHLADGASARAEIPRLGAGADEEPALSVEVRRSGLEYVASASGLGMPWSLELLGAQALGASADGARIAPIEGGLRAEPASPNAPFTVRLRG
jgi:alpha-D-xyloside xylohydrolase